MSQTSPALSDAQTILDNITDAFFSLNSNWQFSYVNRQTVLTLQCEVEDLLGKSIWDVYPGTVGSDFEGVYRQVTREQIPMSFESYYPDHDRWYDVNVYPAPGGIAVYFRDVTGRRREEQRRMALITLTDAFRDALTSEQIVYNACEILGKTLNASRVGLGTIDPSAETLNVVTDWVAPGVDSLAGTLNLRDYGSFIDDLKAGKFISIDDVGRDWRTKGAAGALIHRRSAAFVNVPILEKGKVVAVIFVNCAQARHWTSEELVFIKEVAERTRTASERARNEVELSRVVRDFDRRHRLYETFLENTPDLSYVFGLDHRFTYANKVLLKMWGRSWEEAIGKNCLELGYEPWHAEMHDREIEQVISTKQPIRSEVPFNGTNGRRIYEYIFVPVLDLFGEVEAVAGTTRDVTERKQAEEALRMANLRKDEFLAMLAHELRNPLSPIASAAEVLQTANLDEKLIQRTSKIIGRQVKHMTGLVNDLLDVSRVTQGLVTISKTPLDLKAVIYSAVEQVRPAMEAQHHRLLFDLAPEKAFVLGDEKRLVQIFTNLLNNAAKYTPPGGEIRLRLALKGEQIGVSVQDNGVGMPAELQPHVFELFTQAERTPDRIQGGLGIGLALVKNLVQLHDGTVECFSAGTGKGSEFTVCLPSYEVEGETRTSGASDSWEHMQVKHSLHILVVDDNEDAAEMLEMYLSALGHQVSVEHSSDQALVRAKGENPEVYILDIGLPGMDGNELARRLRADPQTAHAVLIAVTGYGRDNDRLQSMQAGFNRHLTKPVNMAQLASMLDPASYK